MQSVPINFSQSVASSVSTATVEQLAAVLCASGVALLTVGPAGQFHDHDTAWGSFFDGYAIPLFARAGVTASQLQQAGNGEPQLDASVPGILAAILPPIDRRDGFTHVLLARAIEFDPTDPAFRQAAIAVGADPDEVAGNARCTAQVDPAVLVRLGQLVQTTLKSERRTTSLQRELDSLSNQLADTYEELTLIYQLSSGMRVNRSVDDFFLQASMDVMDVMQVRSVGVMLCDASGRVDANPIYGEVQFQPHVVQQLSSDLLARFRANPKPLLVNDVSSDPVFSYLATDATRLLAVPLQRQDQVLGTLYAFDKAGDDFNTQDSKLLGSIANETAIFLENATLFADAQGLMMGLLHSLTSAVDAKDAYTCGHSQRVALLAKEITLQARLPEAFAARVYMAGLLHDVGKIGVPEEVLKKPGKLTDDEFGLMKKHVEIGARILRDVKQVGDLIPGVLYHHERYDGRGYPHNLAGQAIPLMGRILCVADCFDAMTSNRTYRRALPLEVALMEIRRCSGTQFDPMLADAFLQIGADRLRDLMHSVDAAMAQQQAERAQQARETATGLQLPTRPTTIAA
ncbi:MAG: HD domain-containing protein [Tepidisphaeraceae bacterium]